LGNENAPFVTPAGDRSSLLPSTGTSNDSEFNGMWVAQLNDDILGPILRLKEVNQQPGEAALAGMGHEAHQMHQQWEQLMVQDGILCWRVEDQDGQDSHLQLVVPNSQRIHLAGGTCW